VHVHLQCHLSLDHSVDKTTEEWNYRHKNAITCGTRQALNHESPLLCTNPSRPEVVLHKDIPYNGEEPSSVPTSLQTDNRFLVDGVSKIV
jgi:hypothetical protein